MTKCDQHVASVTTLDLLLGEPRVIVIVYCVKIRINKIVSKLFHPSLDNFRHGKSPGSWLQSDEAGSPVSSLVSVCASCWSGRGA